MKFDHFFLQPKYDSDYKNNVILARKFCEDNSLIAIFKKTYIRFGSVKESSDKKYQGNPFIPDTKSNNLERCAFGSRFWTWVYFIIMF